MNKENKNRKRVFLAFLLQPKESSWCATSEEYFRRLLPYVDEDDNTLDEALNTFV